MTRVSRSRDGSRSWLAPQAGQLLGEDPGPFLGRGGALLGSPPCGSLRGNALPGCGSALLGGLARRRPKPAGTEKKAEPAVRRRRRGGAKAEPEAPAPEPAAS